MTQTELLLQDIQWREWQHSSHLYAILDSTHLDDKNERLFRQRYADRFVPLFEGTPDEGLSRIEPLLIGPFSDDSRELFEWLQQQKEHQLMLIWLKSPQPIKSLTRQLQFLLSVDLPDSPNALLRYYDPRVFSKLMIVLEEEQKTPFFTDVETWWIWRPSINEIQDHTSLPQRNVLPVDTLSLNHVQMEQLRQMDIDEFIKNTALKFIYDKNKYSFTISLDDETIKQHVKHHIEEAMKFDLEMEDNICDYLECTANFFGWNHLDNANSNIVTILSDSSLTEDDKLQHIKKCVLVLKPGRRYFVNTKEKSGRMHRQLQRRGFTFGGTGSGDI